MATHRIKLTIEEPTRAWFDSRCVFAVRITASEGQNMPNEIFLHQRTLVDPYTNKVQDEFLAISSAFELSTYPANAPQPQESYEFPFFRKDTIFVYLPSVTKATEFVTEVQNQVATLIKVLDKLDELQTTQTVYIPELDDESTTTTTTTAEP